MNPRGKPGQRAISTPGERTEPRRSPAGVVLSIIIHAVVVLVLARLVIVPAYDWTRLLANKSHREPAERVGFLALPRNDAATDEPPRSGGDDRPRRNRPTEAPPPIVAPSSVLTGITEPPKSAPRPAESGVGPVVGTGGAVEGLRPSFSDPRVWAPPPPLPAAPLSPRQRLDSAIASIVQTFEDSLSRLPREREPGDWTFTRNGKRYGIDGRMIRLGNYSLPTAILALLPLNATANPSGVERDRRLSMIRGEIREQAARAARDDDFHAAVKALRARKEKERQEQKKAAAEQAATGVKP